MRKQLVLFLLFSVFLLLLMPEAGAEIVDRGGCGPSLTWTLDDQGQLVISGEGLMNSHPWPKTIKSVIIENGAINIDEAAFKQCIDLESVTIPDSVGGIGKEAFNCCFSLTSVRIPDNAVIGESAFEDCFALESVAFPDRARSIGKRAFKECGNLTGSINIPYGVTRIEDYTFCGCGAVTAFNIPETVTSIGRSAFESCCMTEIVLPDALTELGDYAFHGCAKLSSINIPTGVTKIWGGTFWSCNFTSIELPAGVTMIGEYAFNSCPSLASIVIPEKVTSIGQGAFYKCKNLNGIVIPDGVATIDIQSFADCTKLESVLIPESITNIKANAFQNCTGLSDVYYTGTTEKWDTITINSTGNAALIDAAFHYHYLSHQMTAHEKAEAGCTEPGTEAYWSCDTCGQLFSDEEGVNQIEAPVEITAVGHAWENPVYTWSADKHTVTAKRTCGNNPDHEESETASAVYLIVPPTDETAGAAGYTAVFRNEAFGQQSKSITIPALNSLDVIRLPSNLKTVEKEAFTGINCQAVIIPEGCTEIADDAFTGCGRLLYVRIPSSVQDFPLSAFEDCGDQLVIDWNHE